MLRAVSSGRVETPHARATRAVLCVAIALALVACGDDAAPSASAQTRAEAGQQVAPAAAPSAQQPSERRERPMPAFGGWTLDGKRLEISSLLGKRVVVFFFNPELKSVVPVAEAVTSIARSRADHNFEIVGVAVGSSPDVARSFVARHALDFQVIDDSNARIGGQFGLRGPVAKLGADAEGYVTFGFAQFPTEGDVRASVESQLRTALRLPEPDAGSSLKPAAPNFVADVLDGDEPFDLARQRGRAVVLLFFLHTCPHCHEFLEFIKDELQGMDAAKRPVLVGVELTGRTHAVREQLRRDGLDFFPVVFDEGGKIAAAYGVFGAVPDVVLIDAQGRIAARRQGFSRDTDAPLLRMRLAKLAGLPVPMLLRKTGFSGNDACGVCHESQHETWQLTTHAGAFDTLVRHGADSNAECIGCHVVGFGQAGGYEVVRRQAELEDVGCESCHGRGGPHLSPGFVAAGDYTAACLTCHDEKHSLGFSYGTFLPRISHAANAHLLELPAKERERILAERGAVRSNLLPSAASHVGSDACQSCHPAEHARWLDGPHADAFATLVEAGHQEDAACIACHTTGFGRKGGFPSGGRAADHPDLARVGCESCHGPGGDHVAPDAPKRGTILSLGDKCDSCVILQICGSCHDEANDPGFEFEVLDKIEATRHGTIEAGTGKPLGDKSAQTDPRALLMRAFAAHDASADGRRWTAR
jgi:peroxiredoxin